MEPGDVVVLDNLPSHKSKAVRETSHQAGARLWFPPKRSTDLISIEPFFAKFKHWMRPAQLRTILYTWRHIECPLETSRLGKTL